MSSDVESMSPEARRAYEKAQREIEKCRIDGGTSLDFSWAGLTVLPPEIGTLTGLTMLDLSFNELSKLPLEIGSDELTARLSLAHLFPLARL